MSFLVALWRRVARNDSGDLNHLKALWYSLAILIAYALPRAIARYAYIRVAVETEQDSERTIKTVELWER